MNVSTFFILNAFSGQIPAFQVSSYPLSWPFPSGEKDQGRAPKCPKHSGLEHIVICQDWFWYIDVYVYINTWNRHTIFGNAPDGGFKSPKHSHFTNHQVPKIRPFSFLHNKKTAILTPRTVPPGTTVAASAATAPWSPAKLKTENLKLVVIQKGIWPKNRQTSQTSQTWCCTDTHDRGSWKFPIFGGRSNKQMAPRHGRTDCTDGSVKFFLVSLKGQGNWKDKSERWFSNGNDNVFKTSLYFGGWTDEYPSFSSEVFAISILRVINHSLKRS